MEWEIYKEKGKETAIYYAFGEFKEKIFSKSYGYGIRVIERDRIGFSYCQREKEIKEAMKKAKENSRYSKKINGVSFPKMEKRKLPKVNVYSQKIDKISEKELFEILSSGIDIIEKKGLNASTGIGASRVDIQLENSNGFFGEYSATEFSMYAEIFAEHGSSAFSISSIDMPKEKEIEKKIEENIEYAKILDRGRKIKAGKYTVVFSPLMLSNYLEFLISFFSGERKRMKNTRIEEGKQIFNKELDIIDNPLLRGTGGRPFDDEGFISQKKILVDKGKVASFLYDLENSTLLKERGGNGYREGYSSTPRIEASNIEVKGSFGEEPEEYIYVISGHGFHTANEITGDVGIEIDSALRIKNGKVKEGIKNFIIGENIFSLFKKMVYASKERERYGEFFLPKVIAFRGVNIV